jgi:hypothetical protein
MPPRSSLQNEGQFIYNRKLGRSALVTYADEPCASDPRVTELAVLLHTIMEWDEAKIESEAIERDTDIKAYVSDNARAQARTRRRARRLGGAATAAACRRSCMTWPAAAGSGGAAACVGTVEATSSASHAILRGSSSGPRTPRRR